MLDLMLKEIVELYFLGYTVEKAITKIKYKYKEFLEDSDGV
ncbi:TPA: hypothetical protein ACF0ZV_002401 [Clostridium perfringens]